MKEWMHPDIGLVVFRKNSRSKRLSLRVRPQRPVTVTIPTYYPYWMAKQMVRQHLEWIKEQQNAQQINAATKRIDWDTKFEMRDKVLFFQATKDSAFGLEFKASNYLISIPENVDLKSPITQELLQKMVIEVLRKEAKNYLPSRTNKFAKNKGIVINQVRIKNMKTRWGSCSSKKNVNFSLYLMLLPDVLIDYVIYHELAHIKHQNHSAAYWQYLEQLLPGAKQLDAAMKHQQMPFI